MKISQFKLCFIVFVLTPALVFAQETRSKEVAKHYTVPEGANLSIEGKYGNIHMESWDKNEVDLLVNIKVTNRSASRAQDYLDKISIAIDDASKSNLSFRTIIDGRINNDHRDDRMEIEYKVKVPRGINLDIDNNYGNLYIQDIRGHVVLDVAYGNLKADALTGNSDVKLSYGNGEIEKMTNGEVVARYSNLDVENAGDLEVSNSYSNINFGKTADIDLNNKYGNISWKSINALDGFSKYGTVKISKLYDALKFDVMYGGGIRVAWISKNFSTIDVESSYATVALNFEKGMSAMLDANLKYCNLKNYDIEFDHSYVDESGSQKVYKGKLGSGSFNSKIKVISEYGTVKIGYTD